MTIPSIERNRRARLLLYVILLAFSATLWSVILMAHADQRSQWAAFDLLFVLFSAFAAGIIVGQEMGS